MRTCFSSSALALIEICFLACTTPKTAPSLGCSKDAECKGDRICQVGVCIDPIPRKEIVSSNPLPTPLKEPEPKQEPAPKPTTKSPADIEVALMPPAQYKKHDGIVEDTYENLTWALSDSGETLTWSEAIDFCKEKGRGWSLPNNEQLKTLFDNGDSEHPPKNDPKGFTIKHPAEIQVTGYYLWSKISVLLGNNGAIDLHDGKIKRTEQKAYALCIRVD
jgi:hypothetical protein